MGIFFFISGLTDCFMFGDFFNFIFMINLSTKVESKESPCTLIPTSSN